MAGARAYLKRDYIKIESELNEAFERISLEESWWAVLMYEKISLEAQAERESQKQKN